MSERRREHSVATASPPGTAGVMISLSRILTKLLLPDERASTIIFFLVSAGLELLCFLLHLLVRRSRFVLYYTTRPRDSRPIRAGYRVHHDVASGDIHFVSAVAWQWPPSPTQAPEEFLSDLIHGPVLSGCRLASVLWNIHSILRPFQPSRHHRSSVALPQLWRSTSAA